jgi:hypothetical protein
MVCEYLEGDFRVVSRIFGLSGHILSSWKVAGLFRRKEKGGSWRR